MSIIKKKKEEAAREKFVYGYARVSHVELIRKGDSIPAQKERIEAYYKHSLKHEGYKWGGIYDEKDHVSAFKTMFWARPAGKELMKILKKGDVLVIDKIDRIWRSLEDFVLVIKKFEAIGVKIHIVNFLGQSVCNDTPMGKFILRQFVLIAELESQIKSQRSRDGLRYARKKGRFLGGGERNLKPGTKIVPELDPVSGRLVKKLDWDWEMRRIMDKIVYMRDELRMTWEECNPKIESMLAEFEGRETRPFLDCIQDQKQYWPRLYNHAIAYEKLGITDVHEIPKAEIIKEIARQHRREMTERKGRKSEIEPVSLQEIKEYADLC